MKFPLSGSTGKLRPVFIKVCITRQGRQVCSSRHAGIAQLGEAERELHPADEVPAERLNREVETGVYKGMYYAAGMPGMQFKTCGNSSVGRSGKRTSSSG